MEVEIFPHFIKLIYDRKVSSRGPSCPSKLSRFAVSIILPVPPFPDVIDIERGFACKLIPKCIKGANLKTWIS